MTSSIHLGVVGCGAVTIGGILPHLTIEDIRDRVEVSAVCDRDATRAEWVAERFGVAHWFTSADEMYRSGVVDAVSIASPIGLHYEHGTAAIEAGLDVHFNKPLALTARDADDLVERARRQNVVVVASPGQALFEEIKATRRLLAEGGLGRLAWAICGAGFGTYHEQEQVRADAPGETALRGEWYYHKPGGGPLYDMTVYALHNLVSVLGPVRSVVAMSGTLVREREVGGTLVRCDADDNTMAVLDFGGDIYAYCYGTAAGTITDGFMPSYFAEGGTVSGYYADGSPLVPQAVELAAAAGISYKGNEGLVGSWLLPHATAPHRSLWALHVFEDIMQLVDARLEGRLPPVPISQAVHVVEIIEAIYEAARSGSRVALRTVFEGA